MFEGGHTFEACGDFSLTDQAALHVSSDPLFGLSSIIKSARIMDSFLPWKHDNRRAHGLDVHRNLMKKRTPADKSYEGKLLLLRLSGGVTGDRMRCVQRFVATEEAILPNRRPPQRLVQYVYALFHAATRSMRAAGSEA